MLVAHQAVIMVFRYVLEELTEQELLDIDKERAGRQRVGDPLRARRRRRSCGWTPFNEVDHLTAEAEDVTEEPDAARPVLSPRSSPRRCCAPGSCPSRPAARTRAARSW